MGKVWEVAAAGDSSVPSTPRQAALGRQAGSELPIDLSLSLGGCV